MKTCNKCGETKEFSEFWKRKSNKDGHRPSCKTCEKERNRERKKSPLLQLEREVRSSIITENKMLFKEGKKLCSNCKNIFLIADMSYYNCKKCKYNLTKEYREKNIDEVSVKAKVYRKKNKEKIKKYREENIEKIKEDLRLYYEENKEKLKEQRRQRYHKQKEGI